MIAAGPAHTCPFGRIEHRSADSEHRPISNKASGPSDTLEHVEKVTGLGRIDVGETALFKSPVLAIGAAVAFFGAAPVLGASPDWSGVYVGVNVGGAFAHGGDAKTVGTAGFETLIPSLAPAKLNTGKSGVTAGGQIGVNIVSGSLVYGVEADVNYVDSKKSSSFTSSATVLGTTLTTSASHQLDYLGTLRARLGVTASERLLIYATGGLAYGHVKNRASVVANAAPSTLFWRGSRSSTRTGFAAGAGAELKISDKISLRGEYLYYDLGSTSTLAAGSPGMRSISALDGIDYRQRTSTNGSIVRAGLNLKL
jgi:outer membrane immunogenic protein